MWILLNVAKVMSVLFWSINYKIECEIKGEICMQPHQFKIYNRKRKIIHNTICGNPTIQEIWEIFAHNVKMVQELTFLKWSSVHDTPLAPSWHFREPSWFYGKEDAIIRANRFFFFFFFVCAHRCICVHVCCISIFCRGIMWKRWAPMWNKGNQL